MAPVRGIVIYSDAGVQGTRLLWSSVNIPPIYPEQSEELTYHAYPFRSKSAMEETVRYWTNVVNCRRHLLPPELDQVELISQLSRGPPNFYSYPQMHHWYREEPDTLPDAQRGQKITKIPGLFHPLRDWIGDANSDSLSEPRHASWLSAQMGHDLPPPPLPTAMDLWVMFFLGHMTPRVNHNKEVKVVHCCLSGQNLKLIMSCRLQFLVPAMGLPATPIDLVFWHGHANYIGPDPPADMPRYGKILDPNRVRSWRRNWGQRHRQGGAPAQQAQAGSPNAPPPPGQQIDGLQNFDYSLVDPRLRGQSDNFIDVDHPGNRHSGLHTEQYESFLDGDSQDPIWNMDMNSIPQAGSSNANPGPSSGPADLLFSFSDSANMTQQQQHENELVIDTDMDVNTDPWAPFYINDGDDETDNLFADADVPMQDNDEVAFGALSAAVEMHGDAAQHGNIGESVPGPDDPGFEEYVASRIRGYLARSEQQE